MTAADQKFDDALVRLAARIGVLQAENASALETVKIKDAALSASGELITSLQGELDGERASRAAEVARLVSEAMALDAQKDLERVNALLVAAGGELPADVPVVETPPAGEPAEVPADAPIDPVDEAELPATEIPAGDTVTAEQPTGEAPATEGDATV